MPLGVTAVVKLGAGAGAASEAPGAEPKGPGAELIGPRVGPNRVGDWYGSAMGDLALGLWPSSADSAYGVSS